MPWTLAQPGPAGKEHHDRGHRRPGAAQALPGGRDQTIEAVRGVSLQVARGEIVGFLGPNGAGKTTTLRMLTTLLPIDGGSATVAGLDVRRQPGRVRGRIGYVSQLGGADELATGRENLTLQGRLYGRSRADVARRVAEVLERFDLAGFADRRVRTYSGGQRRRLDVALGVVHEPEVLFLDEPSTGLDPQNRASLWDHIRGLRDGGTTVFLTTHYLDEADVLCDRIMIIDHGTVVAEGTPRALKQQVAGDAIVLVTRDADAAGPGRRRAGRAARRARPHRGGRRGTAVRQRRRGRAARAAPAARPGGPARPVAPAVRAQPGRRVPAPDRPVPAGLPRLTRRSRRRTAAARTEAAA